MRRDVMRYQAREIERTLAAKKLTARVTGGYCGHRLVTYNLAKPASVDLSAIQRQGEELALALGVQSCRIGRRNGTLTVEIPRSDPVTVDLRRLLESIPEHRPGAAVVGVDATDDTPLLLPLASPNVAHVLVAGTTGSGKTELARAMIASLVMTHNVADLGLVLVDPKRRGYAPFQGLPHLVHGIINDPTEALGVLAWAVEEMERRDREGVSSPRLVVFIDELADLMLVEPEIEGHLTRLVQRGRDAGLHVVACTQKPTAAVIGSVVKANFPTRLVGKVTDHTEALTAAGVSGTGAERLLGRGDFLAYVGGELVRMQGAYVSESEIGELVTRLRGGIAPSRGSQERAQQPTRGRVIDFVERFQARTQGAGEDDAELVAAIIQDHERGLSQRQIEEKHFGFTGGAAYRAVKQALEGATTTTANGR